MLSILILMIMNGAMFAVDSAATGGREEMAVSRSDPSVAISIVPPTEESQQVIFDVNAIYRIKAYQKIIGWVFVENQETRGQKVFIQLEKPNGDIIHYPTVPKERLDVGKQLKNKLYNASGFSASIPLNDGVDVDACTIRLVVKTMKGIYKSMSWRAGMRISSRVEIVPPGIESPAVKFYISLNQCQKAGEFAYQYVVGWVYVEDQETRGQEVFIQLEKLDGTILYYSTIPKERPDVGKSIANAMYNSSGFVASIPLDNGLDVGDCAIRFVVKNKKGIYKSPSWKAGMRISSRIEITPPNEESRAVKYYLNVNEQRKAGEFAYQHLVGWAYVEDHETRGQEIFVQIEKPDNVIIHYSTMSNERPDVGKRFNNPLYNASGFSAFIPLDGGTDIDACRIRFVVRNKEGMFKSLEWKAQIRMEDSPGGLTVFVAANWLLLILTAVTLIVSVWRERSLLLRPSIMAILFFHVMCQWGTALEAGRIEQFLPRPWVFVLLSHGFPIIGLAVSLFIWRRPVRAIWGQLIDRKPEDLSGKNKALVLLALFFAAFMLLYFSHVPFRTTGLYKIFFSPAESGMARDMSVKFLGNAFLRYGHNIMMAVFAPLMATLMIQILLIHWQKRNWSWMTFYLACLVAIFLAASISGARSYSASIIMVILFALLLRRGFPLRPAYLFVIALLILTFPTLLSLLREGEAVTAKKFFSYLRGSTLDRVVIIPMKTGLYHVQYAQQHGYFGIKAIPKLAAVAGVKPLNVPDFIAKYMSGSPLDTSTANTAYIYAYYSYFGLIAFFPCLLGLWLLDLCLLVYRRLSDTMLIPCVASVAIGVNIFSSVEYTIGLFTFGILLLPLVSWAVDRALIMSESVALKKKR